MALILREYLESPVTSIDNESQNLNLNLNINEGFGQCDPVSPNSLMVDIEGIHVGPTRNFTWYTEEALRNSQKSWSVPYQRPLILHHNEKDGKIIGRVLNASYVTCNTRSNTGALLFTCNVSDKDGKDGVRDGRLKTASIGVIAKKVTCSICGNDITMYGECEHERGEVYDNERCYWKIHDMEAKELSYVIVPSDIYSHNVKIYSPQGNNLSESVNFNNSEKEVLSVSENTVLENNKETELKESADIENIKENTEKVETVDNAEELNLKIAYLTEELEKKNNEINDLKELKENAESELIKVNAQLKEMAIEHICVLREKLGRPALLKEHLEDRKQDSLMDSILDLKEELTYVSSNVAELKESATAEEVAEKEVSNTNTDTNTNSIEAVESLEMVKSDALVDENKDHLNKNEKISDLNVKESLDTSNKDYVENIEKIKNYYKL